ncbi:condensin complex subunit 3 isoform X2 [Cylas formicarius]|uniref:condensin complex subunit 3 isoform X2 n=1 Tax=Cylas formicarius TaxID=197179 RepID=UPI002958B9B5|nr:condensin complex subunit 3 isoform X2 [Cylas formicarius]
MKQGILRIVGNAQLSPSNCQRNIKLLKELYFSCNYEEFLEINLKIILGALQQKPEDPYARNIIQFYTEFIGTLTVSENPDANVDNEPHSLLEDVLEEVLKFHDVLSEICQQNACAFVSKTLQSLDNLCLNTDLWDSIEDAMLKKDIKPSVRIQAILALNYLQVPTNPECPIIHNLLLCLQDPVGAVRREVVKILAPSPVTIQDLKNCVLDSDPTVRVEAFKRFMTLEPKHFKIVDRQLILRKGFSETSKLVRKVVIDGLIPKWISDLKGDYVAFLKAIKLDADEVDILVSEDLSTKFVEVLFRSEPVNNIMKSLCLDEGKVLPLDMVSGEMTLYWNLVAHYLKSHDEMEQFLDMALPELTAFCNFIENVVRKRRINELDQCEYHELQYILYNLFDIVDIFDMSEEVGRKTLEKMLRNILENFKVEGRLLTKIVSIARKLWTNLNTFVNEMSEIISNIREPLTESEPSQNALHEAEFKVAEVKVQINILQGNLENALDAKDFLKAATIQKELDLYHIKLEELSLQNVEAEKVRIIKNDPETIYRCLNLLVEILKHYNQREPSLSLTMWKENLLLPLVMKVVSPNIEHSMLKCLAMYCLLDRTMAEQYVMKFCAAIFFHQNKSTLLVAIGAMSDFLRLYGVSMFGREETTTAKDSSTLHQRRLYRDEDVELTNCNMTLSPEVIVDMILDLMDDEDEDIKITAAEAIGKVLISDFPTTPHIITRLVLKLFNPLTGANRDLLYPPRKFLKEKLSIRLEQRLAIMLEEYVNRIKIAKETFVKAVIPILRAITNSPMSSPLRKVKMDSLIKFLVMFTNPHEGRTDMVNVHQTLAFSILKELTDHPGEKVSVYLAKVLNLLQIDIVVTQDIITQCRLVLNEEELDKSCKIYLTKFLTKISAAMKEIRVSNTPEKEIDINKTVDNERTGNFVENVSQTTQFEEVTPQNKTNSRVSDIIDSIVSSDSDVIPSSLSPEPSNSLGSSLRRKLRSSKHKPVSELKSSADTPANKKAKLGGTTSSKTPGNSNNLANGQNRSYNLRSAKNLKYITNSVKITRQKANNNMIDQTDDLSLNDVQSNSSNLRRIKYDRVVKLTKQRNICNNFDDSESTRSTTDTDDSVSVRSLRSSSSSTSSRSKRYRENECVIVTPNRKPNPIRAQTDISKRPNRANNLVISKIVARKLHTDTKSLSARSLRSNGSKINGANVLRRNVFENAGMPPCKDLQPLNRELMIKIERHQIILPNCASNHLAKDGRLKERNQNSTLANNAVSVDQPGEARNLQVQSSVNHVEAKELQVKRKKCRGSSSKQTSRVVTTEYSSTLRQRMVLYETSSDSDCPHYKIRKSSRIRSRKK